MFDEAGLKAMQWAGEGFCCSQIMILLALDEMGRENPDLVRAAQGLCQGLGDCSGPCGVLTGGALALGLYAGKGEGMEDAEEALPLMLESLRDWFAEATAPYGGGACIDILGEADDKPDPVKCGGLVGDAFAQVRRILADNGLDPAQGRDLS